MRTILNIRSDRSRIDFSRWRPLQSAGQVLGRHRSPAGLPFACVLEQARVGAIEIRRSTCTPQTMEADGKLLRSAGQDDIVSALLVVEGRNGGVQYGRESRQSAGDMVLLDNLDSYSLVACHQKVIGIDIPRGRIEDAVGSTRALTSVTLSAGLSGTMLATDFIRRLAELEDRMDDATRTRMASIGADLMIAAIAERFAGEPRQRASSGLLIHRAKVHIDGAIGDPDLSPTGVAMAMGISLRRLQSLFQEDGKPISDWIWERRLKRAAKLLDDPNFDRASIGEVAWRCGFVNQAHFSTRFRRHYGVTPRDHRRSAAERRGGG